MTGEFDGASAAGDEKPVGGGGPADGGGQQQEPKVSQADIDRLRSIKDKEVAEERRARQQAEEERQRLAAELDGLRSRLGTFEHTIQNLDPDAYNALAREAEIAELRSNYERLREEREAERQEREAELARQNWKREQEALAQREGVNPYDPRYQSAINEALQTAQWSKPAAVLAKMLFEKAQREAQAQTQQAPPAQAAPQAAHQTAPPPRGGRPGTADAVVLQDLDKKYQAEIARAKVRGNTSDIPDILRQWRRERAQLTGSAELPE